MRTYLRFLLVPLLFVFSLVAVPVLGASEEQSPDKPTIDFDHPDTLIDPVEGTKNKHFVRRAILSSMARSTSRFEFERPYINHLMGFSAIFQRTTFKKYVTGVQALSLGYITGGGHGFEAGFELASVSNIFAGYRYIYRPETFSLWPFIGAGAGTEVSGIRFSDAPFQDANYNGTKQMGFATLGFLVPLVDIGIKAEARLNFYGTDRLVLSSGVGVVFFL